MTSRGCTIGLALLLAACRFNFTERPPDGGGDDGNRDAMTPARSLALPAGGQLSHVTVAPDGTWYATGVRSNAYRSNDQGATWTRCGDHIGAAIAVTSDGTVWISGVDVARSTDQCATWTNTGSPRFSDFVYADGATIYACTDTGLRIWDGSQWNAISTPADGERFRFMTRGGSKYFIATTNGVLSSTDAVSWALATSGIADPNVLMVAAGATRTYAITGGGPGGVSCSDQDGLTWNVCYGTGGFAIGVDPANDQHVFAGIYDDAAVTTDAFGATTVGVRAPTMDDALVAGITFLPTSDLVIASDRGIFVAPANTTSFSPRNAGLDAWNVESILRSGTDLFLATPGGVLRSSDQGPITASSEGINVNTNVFQLAELPDGRILAGGRMLFVSDDRGSTWTLVYGADLADGYRVFSLLVSGDRVYAGTATRVLTSDPPYASWTPHALPASRSVFAIHQVGAVLWAGTNAGLYLSTDDAASWNIVASIPGALRVNGFADLADGSLVIASNDGVWHSDPTRTTWTRAGLGSTFVDGMTVIAQPATWIASTPSGVAYSRDQGMSWISLPGAETLGASATIVDDTMPGYLLVGSDSRGLVRVPMP